MELFPVENSGSGEAGADDVWRGLSDLSPAEVFRCHRSALSGRATGCFQKDVIKDVLEKIHSCTRG